VDCCVVAMDGLNCICWLVLYCLLPRSPSHSHVVACMFVVMLSILRWYLVSYLLYSEHDRVISVSCIMIV
jgi:hypothetical protein